MSRLRREMALWRFMTSEATCSVLGVEMVSSPVGVTVTVFSIYL